jgi:hypothetical protein
MPVQTGISFIAIYYGYIASKEFPACAGKTTEFKMQYKLGSGFRLSGKLLKDVGLRPSVNEDIDTP